MYFQRTRVQGEQWKYDTMVRSLPSEVCLKPGCCCFGIVFGWGEVFGAIVHTSAILSVLVMISRYHIRYHKCFGGSVEMHNLFI